MQIKQNRKALDERGRLDKPILAKSQAQLTGHTILGSVCVCVCVYVSLQAVTQARQREANGCKKLNCNAFKRIIVLIYFAKFIRYAQMRKPIHTHNIHTPTHTYTHIR